MPLSKAHKEKTREKILEVAGTLFRRHGFESVGIDQIMTAAGLTRGGFYAHFESKADLFVQVLQAVPGFTRMLAERQRGSREDAMNGALDVLATYLDPDNIGYVTANCPMVSLSRDVDKGGAPAREAFTKIIADISALLKNGMADPAKGDPDDRALTVLALCVGAVTMARTSADPALAEKTLRACEAAAQKLLTGAAH